MLTPAPPHPIPAGPLAVRWLGYDLPTLRAGTTPIARVAFENAGAAPWLVRRDTSLALSYHWLDLLGNPIVWEGSRTHLTATLAPGEQVELPLAVRAPIPPARYRLAIDLVDEGRFWFEELDNHRLELEVDVVPRLELRSLAVEVSSGPPELVEVTRRALATQEHGVADEGEAVAFLAPGCRPEPRWSAKLVEAHAEGYAVVAGSVALSGRWREKRRFGSALRPWAPGFGRAPGWSHPLLCPSIVAELVPFAPWTTPVAGLPSLAPATLDGPWLCDGRIRVDVSARDLRPGDRPLG